MPLSAIWRPRSHRYRVSPGLLVATATLGTTLAPWGLAFIQSYAVDKKLTPRDWKFERIDVVVGAVSTGVIGFFVVVACAETLYRSHTHINDASDAAVALTPLAGHLASTLFAVGLVGAGLLAAAILPLSTSYSVSEAFGKEGRVTGNLRTEPIFFSTYIAMTALAAAIVLIPGAPLVPILFLTHDSTVQRRKAPGAHGRSRVRRGARRSLSAPAPANPYLGRDQRRSRLASARG